MRISFSKSTGNHLADSNSRLQNGSAGDEFDNITPQPPELSTEKRNELLGRIKEQLGSAEAPTEESRNRLWNNLFSN